jgi:hypothetical protein
MFNIFILATFDEIIGLPNLQFDNGFIDNGTTSKKRQPIARLTPTNDPKKFLQRYRMSERLVDLLLENLPYLRRKTSTTNRALSAPEKILVFLRFAASNHHYYDFEDLQGVGKTTAMRCIKVLVKVNMCIMKIDNSGSHILYR